MKRAVFLDRDGTLNIEKSYLCDPDKLELFPDALPSLKRLIEADFTLFIVTNQSGIGRGYYAVEDMNAVNQKLVRIAEQEGITFSHIYFAPEAPEDPSYGRKPSPQFLLDAQTKYGIDLSHSFMIGDKLSDLQCGWNAGVQKSILVLTGYGRELSNAKSQEITQAHQSETLSNAVDYILKH